jgi:hypothetical protein
VTLSEVLTQYPGCKFKMPDWKEGWSVQSLHGVFLKDERPWSPSVEDALSDQWVIEHGKCPFCGGEADESRCGSEQDALCYWVRCPQCDIRTANYAKPDEAWAAWDRRVK